MKKHYLLIKHLAVWSSLLKFVDFKEFLTIFLSVEHQSFADGELILKQGSHDSALYFINSGKVEVFFHKNKKKVRIKAIGAGEILGAGTFFEASVSTISARSLGAKVSVLSPGKTKRWDEKYADLKSKLQEFCSRFNFPPEFFCRADLDRRMSTRLRISGTMRMIVFDKEGRDTGFATNGYLFDISAGGVSFFLRIPKKDSARYFLGKSVGITIPSLSDSSFNITGTVMAVRSFPSTDTKFGVSVQFGRDLAQRELKDLVVAQLRN